MHLKRSYMVLIHNFFFTHLQFHWRFSVFCVGYSVLLCVYTIHYTRAQLSNHSNIYLFTKAFLHANYSETLQIIFIHMLRFSMNHVFRCFWYERIIHFRNWNDWMSKHDDVKYGEKTFSLCITNIRHSFGWLVPQKHHSTFEKHSMNPNWGGFWRSTSEFSHGMSSTQRIEEREKCIQTMLYGVFLFALWTQICTGDAYLTCTILNCFRSLLSS